MQELGFAIIREVLMSSHYPKYIIKKSFVRVTSIDKSATNKIINKNKKLNYVKLSLPCTNKKATSAQK